MSLVAKNALVSYLEAFIDGLDTDSPLFDTKIIRAGRGSIKTGFPKHCRIQIRQGKMTYTDDIPCKERNVRLILQFFVKPAAQTDEAYDEAIDQSYLMAKTAFDELEGNNLNGQIRDIQFAPIDPNYEMGLADSFATTHGATYLYGLING